MSASAYKDLKHLHNGGRATSSAIAASGQGKRVEQESLKCGDTESRKWRGLKWSQACGGWMGTESSATTGGRMSTDIRPYYTDFHPM